MNVHIREIGKLRLLTLLIECPEHVTSEVNSLDGALHKSYSYKWKTVAVFCPFGIRDDNVKCPNYVPRGSYPPPYFFSFPNCDTEERSGERISPKLQLQKKLATIIRTLMFN